MSGLGSRSPLHLAAKDDIEAEWVCRSFNGTSSGSKGHPEASGRQTP